jgi:hypothetical protein
LIRLAFDHDRWGSTEYLSRHQETRSSFGIRPRLRARQRGADGYKEHHLTKESSPESGFKPGRLRMVDVKRRALQKAGTRCKSGYGETSSMDCAGWYTAEPGGYGTKAQGSGSARVILPESSQVNKRWRILFQCRPLEGHSAKSACRWQEQSGDAMILLQKQRNTHSTQPLHGKQSVQGPARLNSETSRFQHASRRWRTSRAEKK